MKIIFLDAETFGEVPLLSSLKELGDLVIYPVTTPDQTLSRIHDADIVLTNKVVLDRAVLEKSTHLKLICVTATGINNVDVTFAQQRDILVKNAVGYAVDSVAQHTFTLLLALQEQILYYDQYVKSGGYTQSRTFTHLEREFRLLKGKRLGIIGLGDIGRGVAHIAEAFGMEVVYHSISGKQRPEKYKHVSWEDLLQLSDVISVHSPLTEQTRNLINAETLRQMKSTAILLNLGRGGIINETDLAKAIDEDQIAGAGLDVFEQEPLTIQNPLLSVQKKHKLILTPHIAWAAVETRERLMEVVIDHIRNFVRNGQMQQ
ncbi:D-2-hydroxyacid dehydrogenase [Xanthocytophaga agilis]|uniref:D-2-hydroxyacid dehydrogenase n=1 Tax=Xanthocytophaga agilis TaxID=3048010 RepID=A0AAE3R6A7_9BACT|nr:D-2-hydroxyacid dehydrogenase [Xanthocytophaga agilis]MDJ1502392.1 D-2-hydroxyacid dehydrogenase [Xanthocytophaga agilis]